MKKTALILALLCPLAASAATHPRLFFGPGDVARLQQQAKSTHQVVYTGLKNGVDQFVGTNIASDGTVTWNTGRTFNVGDRRDIGNALEVFAFLWQIDGGSQYFQLAHDWLMSAASWGNLDLDGSQDLMLGHLLTGVAIAYDLLYPNLTASERTTVQQVIARNAAAQYANAVNGVWWSAEYGQNHNWVNTDSFGLAALALEGEWDQATVDAWRNQAVANAQHIAAVTDPMTDGAWHEGPSYLAYGLLWHLPFVDALKRAGHEDLTAMGIVKGLGAYRAWNQLPEQPNAYVLAYGDFFGFGQDDQLFALRYAGSRYGDGVAQAAADRWLAGTKRNTYAPEQNAQIFEFLYWDPSVATTDLHTQPLDWYGPNMGGVVFRSSWDPGALLFGLKCGDYGGKSFWQRLAASDPLLPDLDFSHDHADDNGFYLYGNGSWLAPEADGYYIGQPSSPPPMANQTVYHNSLTVDGAGQLGDGVRSNGDGSTRYGWFSQRQGQISFHGSTSHFAYAVGDGAKLYPASMGLTRWDRHALFLDRKWVVLRDVVESSLSHDYHFIAHFMNGASQDGSWIQGTGTGGQLLGVAVVAPQGFGVDFFTQAPAHISDLNPAGQVSVASIHPAAPAQNATFLTALVPTGSWAGRQQVAALDQSQADGGLTVTDGAHVAAAIFNSSPAGERRAGGYHLVGTTGVAEYDAGALSRALLVAGSLLEDATGPVLQQDGTSTVLEADGLNGATLALTGDALGKVTVRAPAAQAVTWFGQAVPFSRQGDLVLVNTALAAPPGASTGGPTDPATGATGTPSSGGAAAGGADTGTSTAGSTAGSGGALASGGCSAGAEAGLLALIGLLGALRRKRQAKREDERRAA
ncbi:DUF4962 domain-containing protein [Anaeromyxobacter paludicola]|uniref:Heparinase II/III-like protein n=1 Tax=Anaeromyxobacter paludicola TaxID=2918171 RepID=A0ABM7XC25_9BACT|nr:DUF4962 domain-containing protein [Anaeromyxobacter paludicola]BDG09421.1 hypothetical protein AMPC_25340 [Anaeromyxobacter paludicola]